jgi:hypothetical protein
MTQTDTKCEADQGMGRVTSRFQGENATMSSPIPLVHILGNASEANDTKSFTAADGGVSGTFTFEPATGVDAGAFAFEPATGVDAGAFVASPGGPPVEVLEQIARAQGAIANLRDHGRQVRFITAAGRRTRIELQDGYGATIRALSVREAIELAAGESLALD